MTRWLLLPALLLAALALAAYPRLLRFQSHRAAEAATASLAEWLANPALRGGDYWRQGIFYRLLLAHDPEQSYAASSVTFDFLRPV